MKKEELSNKMKVELLHHLALHLSFIKTVNEFPMISIEDIQRVLNESAELFQKDTKKQTSFRAQEVFLYTDGASRGNPGDASAGVVILDKEGNTVQELKRYLGKLTNNSAEYHALLLGVKEVLKIGALKVHIFSDSELMVNQLKGIYKVKSQSLLPLYNEVTQLWKKLKSYDIMHISREQNRHADRLANEAINERRK